MITKLQLNALPKLSTFAFRQRTQDGFRLCVEIKYAHLDDEAESGNTKKNTRRFRSF